MHRHSHTDTHSHARTHTHTHTHTYTHTHTNTQTHTHIHTYTHTHTHTHTHMHTQYVIPHGKKKAPTAFTVYNHGHKKPIWESRTGSTVVGGDLVEFKTKT